MASFVIPNRIKYGIGVEGDYFSNASNYRDAICHVKVTRNDSGYLVEWERIMNSENGDYDYFYRKTQLDEKLDSQMNPEMYFFSIEFLDEGMMYNYTYFEKTGVKITDFRALKYGLRILGFGILMVCFIIAFAGKKDIIAGSALAMQLALVVMFLMMFACEKDYEGKYKIYDGIMTYDFYIEEAEKDNYSIVLSVMEMLYSESNGSIDDLISSENMSFYHSIYDKVKADKKGLKLSDAFCEELNIERFVDEGRIVEKNSRFYYEFKKGDEVTRIEMVKENSKRNRNLITVIVGAVLTILEFVLFIIFYLKNKKVRDNIPYIPYGNYKLRNMIFVSKAYEEYASYALKNMENQNVIFEENYFQFATVNYENAKYQKDCGINLPGEFDKTWGRSKTTRVSVENMLWYILRYKNQIGLLTTINEEPLMLLEMEACNEE